MIILISPSKTFKHTNMRGTNLPIFHQQSLVLRSQLKSFSSDDFRKGFKISEKMALDVYQYYHEEGQTFSSGHLYDGILYKKLNIETLKIAKKQRLFIFSALYGLLTPYDQIYKYRLDFQQTLLKNLYAYWQEPIHTYLKAFENEVIINLASSEFSKLLNNDLGVITIHFQLVGKKISNVLLKQMRGMLARHLLENDETLDGIKRLEISGFKYDASTSNSFHYFFIKTI